MKKIIGIDLGTTNSCVALFEGKQVVVLSNSEGKRTTPSVVAFTPAGIKVGDSAKRQAIVNPRQTVSSVKRFMGEPYEDVKRLMGPIPYEIKSTPDGDVTFSIGDINCSPQEISAHILRKIKKTAEEYLGQEITEAVITVPAYFSEKQRLATKEAGLIANLNVRRILNEPTAAALAYGIQERTPGKVVVFDLGGGTFDISILDCDTGFYEVMATSGNTHLGGDDFDMAIMDWLISGFNREYETDLWKFPEAVQRIKEAAERAKVELSSFDITEINIPYLMAIDNIPLHLQCTLTRSRFEQLVGPLVEQCYQPCEKAVADAGITLSQIDRILLVGGSTRMPVIKEMVQSYFGMKPSYCVNPDEIVAMGAAWEGALLNKEFDSVVLMDVTPLTLGVQTEGGMMSPIIHANETIPISRHDYFTTTEDFQEAVTIQILQGEGFYAKTNKLIGTFTLKGIFPALAGEPRIKVLFDMDKDGLLTVTAEDEGTGSSCTICIEHSGNLTQEEIERMRTDAGKNEELEQKRIKWICECARSEKIVNQIKDWMKKLDRRITDDDTKVLTSLITQYSRIVIEEDLEALSCIMIELNGAWEEARRSLFKVKSIKLRDEEFDEKNGV